MALPEYTIRQLLEAGVHFGHRKHLWNPKMSRYIYGTRKNIHIIDLSQTAPMLYEALQAISNTVSKGGRILMVGTKRQAQDHIADAAKQSAQYFVNARWLGGMLTNWKTISQAIQRLCDLDVVLDGDTAGRTKKEILNLTRERDKLDRNLGGIRDMGGVPDMLFVIDSNREAIAIEEAKRLDIPVAAVLDSNSNPDGITYPIPGNDDAARSITLYCDLVAKAAIDGLSRAESRTEEGSSADESAGDNAKSGDEKSRSSRRNKLRKTDSDRGGKTGKSNKSDSKSTDDRKDKGNEAKAGKKDDSKSSMKTAANREKKTSDSDKKSEDKDRESNESKSEATGKTDSADTESKEEADRKTAEAKKASATHKTEDSQSESSKSADNSE